MYKTLNCTYCSASFIKRVFPSTPIGKYQYCSRKCRYSHLKIIMKNNQFWDNPVCRSNLFKKGHASLVRSGPDSPHWKNGRIGGTTWNIWGRAVKERDNYTCQHCGKHYPYKSKQIVAHHVQSYNKHPDLKFDINNGITLCRSCHMKTHRDNLKTKTTY